MENKTERSFVSVPLENHNAIHGQFGNIRKEIQSLQRILINADLGEYVELVEKIHIELQFLEKYYPPHNPENPF